MPVPVSLRERVRPLAEAFATADLEILVDLAAFVAFADGVIEESELEAMHEAFEQLFHSKLSDVVVKTLVGSAIDAIQNDGPETFARRLGEGLRERDKRLDGIRFAFAIAAADHEISGIERERIALVAEAAGLTGAELRRIDLESRP